MNREAIYSALFAKISSLTVTFNTISRRLRAIDAVEASEMPAIFQVQQDENFQSRPNLPTVKVLNVDWWLYVAETDPSQPPSTRLNNALDVIDGVLGQDGAGWELETLGGLVYNAKINGVVEIFEGVLGDKAMAIVPIRIVKAN